MGDPLRLRELYRARPDLFHAIGGAAAAGFRTFAQIRRARGRVEAEVGREPFRHLRRRVRFAAPKLNIMPRPRRRRRFSGRSRRARGRGVLRRAVRRRRLRLRTGQRSRAMVARNLFRWANRRKLIKFTHKVIDATTPFADVATLGVNIGYPNAIEAFQDTLGIGTTPYLWDQYAVPFYDKCVVMGGSIHVKFTFNQALATDMVSTLRIVHSDQEVATPIHQLSMKGIPHSRIKTLKHQAWDEGKNSFTHKQSWRRNAMFNTRWNDDDTVITVVASPANPTKKILAHFEIASHDGVTTLGVGKDYSMRITMIQYVLCFKEFGAPVPVQA